GIVQSKEIGHPTGQWRRYRPTYKLTQLALMTIWGNNASGYWGLRVVYFGLTCCLAWWALWVWLGGLPAAVIVAWVFRFPFWSDVWCRLGATEDGGALGTAMVAAAIAGITVRGRRARSGRGVSCAGWWVMLAGGAVLAMGAKESFLFLVPMVWLFI